MPQSSWVKLIFHSWLKMNMAFKNKMLSFKVLLFKRDFLLTSFFFFSFSPFFFYSHFVLYVFSCFTSVFLVCFHLVCPLQKTCIKKVWYRAIQAGLLTPLTFARHRLSPLAAFTSGAYFLQMEGSNSEFANFILPTLKAFFEAHSHNVSGNKQ